jgi:Protein of unknown function (DUF1566)
MKKIRLHKGLSREEIAAVAENTLTSRGVKAPEPGDTMPDGTIFVGISPDTRKSMYAAASDAPKRMTFAQAKGYAAALDAHGHKDWRVPSKGELEVLFNNRAAIGGFDSSTDSYPGSWYWSADVFVEMSDQAAYAQRFSTGECPAHPNLDTFWVRCVR